MVALPGLSPRRAAAPAKVLLVHRDEDLRGRLARACERSDMHVIEAGTGADGLRTLFDAQPDAVVLNNRLPDLTGMMLLNRVRELCDAPVFMLQDAYDEIEAVTALRAGADRVLAEPFGVPEAVARIEALLRREAAAEPQARPFYRDDKVEVNVSSAEVRIDDCPVQLTPLEFRLLWEFVSHPRQTLSPEQLLQRVWGDDLNGRERVKIYVGYLRARFRAHDVEPPIVTVRGFGYRYEPGK